MKASRMMKKMLRSFWKPWKRFLPSGVVMSNLNNPLPFNNCRMMLAVTMGPMPRLMMLPNWAPRTMLMNSSCCKVLSPAPKTGMRPSTK